MAKESDDGILEQVHEHIAEFLKAVEAGKTRVAEFTSAKSLAEELMQNHAKQPAQRFTGKGAEKYRCLFCTNIYETTAHQTQHVLLMHSVKLQETVRINLYYINQ